MQDLRWGALSIFTRSIHEVFHILHLKVLCIQVVTSPAFSSPGLSQGRITSTDSSQSLLLTSSHVPSLCNFPLAISIHKIRTSGPAIMTGERRFQYFLLTTIHPPTFQFYRRGRFIIKFLYARSLSIIHIKAYPSHQPRCDLAQSCTSLPRPTNQHYRAILHET